MAAELEVRSVSKRFGGNLANDRVSFQLEKGEILGLIGPNGAGKTTTLNMISGLMKPDSGDIFLRGERVTGLASHEMARRGLLRTFQTPRVFSNMSVYENLQVQAAVGLFSGKAAQVAANERAEHLLEMIGLNPLRDAQAKELSGGQQALLQVAAGFMGEKLSCYLLDEAFSGINHVIAEKMVELILHERDAQGVSYLIISHEMPTIRRLCDRVIVMANGAVLAEGSLDEVSRDPEVISAYLGGGVV